MKEVGIRLKADTTQVQKAMRDLESKVEKIEGKMQPKSNAPNFLISNQDIQKFQTMNREFDKFSKTLTATLTDMRRFMQQFQGFGTGNTPPNIPVSSQSGGFGSFGYSAIGYIGGLVSAGMLYNQMRQGMDLIREEEQFMSRFATRIGTYRGDFQKAREDAARVGAFNYYTARDTMLLAEQFVSQAGVRDVSKMWRDVQEIQRAARGTGIEPEVLAQSGGFMARIGAVRDGEQRKFAELLAGAIDKTSMRGRERELIDSIQSLAKSSYQTQLSISQRELQNIVGLQAAFTQRGITFGKSVELSAGLDAMLRSSQDEEMMILMGYGSRYQGLAGRRQLRHQMAKGITDPQNLKTFMENLDRIYGGNYDAKWIALDEMLQRYGINNPELVDFLLRQDVQKDIMSGRFTQQQINQMMRKGRTDLSRKRNEYMQSSQAIRDRVAQRWEETQKWLGQIGDRIFYTVADWFTSLPTSVQGLLTGTTAIGGSMGIGMLGKAVFSRFFGGGGGMSGGSILGGLGAGIRKATKSAVNIGSKAWNQIGRFGSRISGGISNFFRGSWIPPLLAPLEMLEGIFQPPDSIAKREETLVASTSMEPILRSKMEQSKKEEIKRQETERSLLDRRLSIVKQELALLGKGEKNITRMERSDAFLPGILDKFGSLIQGIFSNVVEGFRYSFAAAMPAAWGTGGNEYLAGGGTVDQFKHMKLKSTANLTAKQIDDWIARYAPKGSVMLGKGAAFLRAAQESGLDVRYLVAHAAHETAWGTSKIAREKGNMYGIGAFDASPYKSAYGYDSVVAGIIEGAKWIAKNYVDRGQDTLYKMRHNRGVHEYATDPLWDEKIAKIMTTAPAATVNVKVSGSIQGLTQENNATVAQAIADAFTTNAINLSYGFSRGFGGNLA